MKPILYSAVELMMVDEGCELLDVEAGVRKRVAAERLLVSGFLCFSLERHSFTYVNLTSMQSLSINLGAVETRQTVGADIPLAYV